MSQPKWTIINGVKYPNSECENDVYQSISPAFEDPSAEPTSSPSSAKKGKTLWCHHAECLESTVPFTCQGALDTHILVTHPTTSSERPFSRLRSKSLP